MNEEPSDFIKQGKHWNRIDSYNRIEEGDFKLRKQIADHNYKILSAFGKWQEAKKTKAIKAVYIILYFCLFVDVCIGSLNA